ncbi:hypothetical protein D9611_007521 [Ephemerocybe angulata]|uniref:Uncharacterized protein n=1 Tax=Ephemerocybe angulata TaxID=980116 RepID=A0A8H5FL47_9AGAR|nr:hypothetical protein D9611_007521 [Tulosesus angulatus]
MPRTTMSSSRSLSSTHESGTRRSDDEKIGPRPANDGATGTHNLPLKVTDSVTTRTISRSEEDGLPPLHFSYHMRYVVIYILFLLVCNFVIPLILFYPLVYLTKLSIRHVVGISSAALGLSSCFDAPFRLWRLTKHRTMYGPLGDDVWWHLDFVMWTYTFATIIFAIPLAIAAPIEYYNFFLMSTVMLICPIGLVFLVSLFSPKFHVWCSSDAPGTPMKPAAFYVVEDIAAVDFRHGRDYRKAIHERYHASPPFRQLMLHITVYWTICSLLYCGVTALVSWLAPLHFAFGWVLGQMFIWGAVCAFGCRYMVLRGLKKEREWWKENNVRQRASFEK